MATTNYMTRHTGIGKTIMETLKDSFDYGKNPDKTRNGDLVKSYQCDPRTVDAEFMLSKAKYNIKMMAEALQYLQENNLLDYGELAAKTETAADRFHDLAGKIQKTEAAQKRNAGLRDAVVTYARTRPVFDEYKAKKYSRAYLSKHDAEIADYRAARASMQELLQGRRLPTCGLAEQRKKPLLGGFGNPYYWYVGKSKEHHIEIYRVPVVL